MGRFRNRMNDVVVSVDDSKDNRFATGAWERLDADESGEPSDNDKPEPPPMGGKGSGESEWRAYADAVGVDVTKAEKRDDIVELIKAAGHAVESVQE